MSKFSLFIFFIVSVAPVSTWAKKAATKITTEPKLDKLSAFNHVNGSGVAYLVMQNGKITHKNSYGYADPSKKNRLTSKSPFIIGSLSKQMTAMAILLLEKDGKLNEEDLASKYLPELPIYASGIKIRHLLHHQAGLPDYNELCLSSKAPVGNPEILAFLKTKKENKFPPGSKYTYSNTGYVVLAEIIRKVSGMSFQDFMQKNIFTPLGMKTTFIMTPEKEPAFQKVMHSYAHWPFLEINDNNPCNYKQGPGSIVTNLEEYSKWMTAVEKNTLISDDWTKKMFTPAALENNEPTQYADGWFVDVLKNQKLIYHEGAWLSFRTYAGYLPGKHTWVAIFSNYGDIDLKPIGEALLQR